MIRAASSYPGRFEDGHDPSTVTRECGAATNWTKLYGAYALLGRADEITRLYICMYVCMYAYRTMEHTIYIVKLTRQTKNKVEL